MKRARIDSPSSANAPSLKNLAISAILPQRAMQDVVQYVNEHTYLYYIRDSRSISFDESSLRHLKKMLVPNAESFYNHIKADPFVLANMFFLCDETLDDEYRRYEGRSCPYLERFGKLRERLGSDGTDDLYKVAMEHRQTSEEAVACAMKQTFSEAELSDIVWKLRRYMTLHRLSDFEEMSLEYMCEHEPIQGLCSAKCGIKLVKRTLDFEEDEDVLLSENEEESTSI